MRLKSRIRRLLAAVDMVGVWRWGVSCEIWVAVSSVLSPEVSRCRP